MNQCFPSKNLNKIEKINSLARFAIYYLILIYLFSDDPTWGSISIIILLITLFLGSSENFTSNNIKCDNHMNETEIRKCQKPTHNNPFMNRTLGDDSDRPPACKYEDSKKEMESKFRSNMHVNSNNMWGQYSSSRQFYTMPNTSIVNDMIGLGQACFGKGSGNCKTFGKDCLKTNDTIYHTQLLQSAY